MTTLIISNGEVNDIMKIIKLLEEFDLLIRALAKQLKLKLKKQNVGFLGMLLDILGASL